MSSSLQHWLDAPVRHANERDKAANLDALAAEHGLTFDPCDWDYPAFKNEEGRIIDRLLVNL